MAAGSAAAAPKPNGARKWLCGSKCPYPSWNPTIRRPQTAVRLAFLAGIENPVTERRRRVRYSEYAQLKRPLDAIRGFYACPAHVVSPGVYGTHGSNRPGVSRYRIACAQPISEVK